MVLIFCFHMIQTLNYKIVYNKMSNSHPCNHMLLYLTSSHAMSFLNLFWHFCIHIHTNKNILLFFPFYKYEAETMYQFSFLFCISVSFQKSLHINMWITSIFSSDHMVFYCIRIYTNYLTSSYQRTFGTFLTVSYHKQDD